MKRTKKKKVGMKPLELLKAVPALLTVLTPERYLSRVFLVEKAFYKLKSINKEKVMSLPSKFRSMTKDERSAYNKVVERLFK